MDGTRLIGPEELASIPGDVPGKASIEIRPMPKARPTDRKVLNAVMAKEYAVPVSDGTGRMQGILYGGRVVNHDYTFVDRVREMVFGKEIYRDKPVGTVTIFLDDVPVFPARHLWRGSRARGTHPQGSLSRHACPDDVIPQVR